MKTSLQDAVGTSASNSLLSLGETCVCVGVCVGVCVLMTQTIKMGYCALLPPSPKLRKSEEVANLTMELLYKRLSTARFLKVVDYH